MNVHDAGYLSERRLQDILALIQILGYGENPYLTPRQICIALQDMDVEGEPGEAKQEYWEKVARQHLEFFRVSGRTPSISLAARFAAGSTERAKPLEPEVVQGLMRCAIDIHDRESRRRERWTLYLPLVIAVIGALGSVTTAIIGLSVKG